MQVSPIAPRDLPTASTTTPKTEDAMRAKARELEASFLAEMLKLSGVGKAQESFSGGVGEEQFSSFLTDEYARIMVEGGGIGLAESIFQSLQKGAQNAK
ncbi:chemotaxis protein chel [Rhodobacter sp. TJ_12]|nr:chemotaxis protein chel [Rhodobacter sp. TJ_12]